MLLVKHHCATHWNRLCYSQYKHVVYLLSDLVLIPRAACEKSVNAAKMRGEGAVFYKLTPMPAATAAAPVRTDLRSPPGQCDLKEDQSERSGGKFANAVKIAIVAEAMESVY